MMAIEGLTGGLGKGEKRYEVWGRWSNKALMCLYTCSSVIVDEGAIVRIVEG
jgi:hypothetical protein